MRIHLARIYDPPQRRGYRVLADRIWPRGISREKAAIDEWCKELAPTPALRTWFSHDPDKWEGFAERYRKELSAKQGEARALLERSGKRPLILLTATKDMDHTHLIVLKACLETL